MLLYCSSFTHPAHVLHVGYAADCAALCVFTMHLWQHSVSAACDTGVKYNLQESRTWTQCFGREVVEVDGGSVSLLYKNRGFSSSLWFCSGTKSTLVKVMTFISWAPLQLRLEKATFPSRTWKKKWGLVALLHGSYWLNSVSTFMNCCDTASVQTA